MKYTDEMVEEALVGLIDGEWDRENCVFDEGARVQTFAQGGILSNNKGLVITMPDGSEYQVTIARSR